jgi:thioredoxin reductase (NADPH)
MYDVVIVGAGPVGLECAIRSKRAGLNVIVLEKGVVCNSLVGYPYQMEFFSTPELLEIGDYPFTCFGYKPTREEALDYYRRVAKQCQLDIYLRTVVLGYERLIDQSLHVHTDKGAFTAKNVIIATGFFDFPNMLGVPGESLGHVSHYFQDAHPYAGLNCVVIGAKNSAAKAALQLYRHGASVTLLVRGNEISPKVKYWIRPDLLNRIEDGSIGCVYNASVESITGDAVSYTTNGVVTSLRADAVFALTGYLPDYSLLRSFDVACDEEGTPMLSSTFCSTNPGVYLAGTVCGGRRTSTWFIENGRQHAEFILNDIVG